MSPHSAVKHLYFTWKHLTRNSDNTFIWLWINLCDVALDAFLWFYEFIAPCYLLQLSYCGCFLFLVSHPHLPHYSNRVPSPTPQHTHMTSPHTPPVRVIRLSTGQKNSISSPAFHLKNNLRSAFDQWSGAFSCLLCSRHGAAFICRVAAGHS